MGLEDVFDRVLEDSGAPDFEIDGDEIGLSLGPDPGRCRRPAPGRCRGGTRLRNIGLDRPDSRKAGPCKARPRPTDARRPPSGRGPRPPRSSDSPTSIRGRGASPSSRPSAPVRGPVLLLRLPSHRGGRRRPRAQGRQGRGRARDRAHRGVPQGRRHARALAVARSFRVMRRRVRSASWRPRASSTTSGASTAPLLREGLTPEIRRLPETLRLPSSSSWDAPPSSWTPGVSRPSP